MRTKAENKKYLVIILLFAILSTFIVLPKSDVYAASASVSISMPSSVTQGQNANATITVTGRNTSGIKAYLLLIKGPGGISIPISAPTGSLIGTNTTETSTVTIPLSTLSAGAYKIEVEGEVTLNEPGGFIDMDFDVSASQNITIVAPTTTTTTTQSTTTTTTTTTEVPSTTTTTTTEVPSTTSSTRTTTTTSSTRATTTTSTTTTRATTTTQQASTSTTAGGDYTPINERRVTTVNLDIRQGPSISSVYLGEIAADTVLNVKGITESGWYVIDLDGQDVYLAGSYLREFDEEIDGSTTTTTVDETDETDETNETDETDETTEETTTAETTPEETTDAELTTQEETTPVASEDNDNEGGLASPNTISIIIGVLIALLLVLVVVYIILRRRLSTVEAEQDDFFDYEDI